MILYGMTQISILRAEHIQNSHRPFTDVSSSVIKKIFFGKCNLIWCILYSKSENLIPEENNNNNNNNNNK